MPSMDPVRKGMKLSFVIPAFNEEKYLPDCIEAILREKKTAPCEVEIVVVNNASTDHTEEVAKHYPEVKVVNEPEKGLVRARRAGFLAATGGLIANVDADTRITAHWIEKVAAEFSKDEKLVAFSGPFIYYDLPKKVRFFVRFFYYIGFFFYLIIRFVFRTGSMLQGGNFVVRRSALEKIGGYDTNIYFYGEDTDIARRLSKVGKVKFSFKLPAYSSGRRLAKEGALTMGLRYGMNYLWIILFKRPFSNAAITQEIRLDNQGKPIYAPKNKFKEAMLATAVTIIFLVGAFVAAFIIYSLAETGTVSAVNFIRFETAIGNLSSSTANVIKEKWDEHR